MKVLLASFDHAVTEPRPAGASFGSQPNTRAAGSSRASRPRPQGRYEHTLNARPNPPSGRSVWLRLFVLDHSEPAGTWCRARNRDLAEGRHERRVEVEMVKEEHEPNVAFPQTIVAGSVPEI